jgi:hypothetical protein
MTNKIYLSIQEANTALDDKYRLEALAFALLVKLNFNSSAIKSPKIRCCKEMFHIGSTRMSRIIRNGLKYGYLRREGNLIIANSIHSKKFNVSIERKYTYSATKTISHNLRSLIDLIRKSVLLNHISKQTACSDTFLKRDCPEDVSEYRKARHKIKKTSCRTESACVGLSNRRISEITHTKLYRAKRLIHSLVSSNLVTVNRRAVKTDINPNGFNRETANRWNKESGHSGYFFCWKGAIYQRITNEYRLSSSLIHYLF